MANIQYNGFLSVFYSFKPARLSRIRDQLADTLFVLYFLLSTDSLYNLIDYSVVFLNKRIHWWHFVQNDILCLGSRLNGDQV